eukprot:1524763-Pyramimonas_sp.AAC.1
MRRTPKALFARCCGSDLYDKGTRHAGGSRVYAVRGVRCGRRGRRKWQEFRRSRPVLALGAVELLASLEHFGNAGADHGAVDVQQLTHMRGSQLPDP